MRPLPVLLICLAASAQQPGARQARPQPAAPLQRQSPAPASTPSQPDTVLRISVTLVQVDAVVTDSKGKHIPDLKPEDFEIYQDGKLQKITHFTYVATSERPAAPAAVVPANRKAPPAPPPPPSKMRPRDVRRTIALVVDDLGLSFESIAFVRQALKKFVDQQMQPGDLVAIVRTGAGMGAFQQFTSDKRQLYAAIDRVKWNFLGRGGVTPFAPISTGTGNDDLDAAIDRADEFRTEYFSVGTLGALNFIIQGLKDLPGRKSVVLLSDNLRIFDREGNSDRILEQLQRLTDMANRSSVVIYTIDARGLPVLGLTAADNVKDPMKAMEALSRRSEDYFESQNGLNYLAAETGGMFLHDNNDIAGGIRQVLDDQSGYYLIGYNPGEATFKDKEREKFHRVKVKVKRPGLSVRSRNGFYGVPEQEVKPVIRGREQQLAYALMSPFASGGIPLRLTGLFAENPKTGSYVYSLLHIGAKDVMFAEEPDGWHKAVMDIVMITYGGDGAEIDRTDKTYTLRLRGDAYKAALENGFIHTLNHTVKKPGAYQLRVAVRDAISEKVGSASQFVEVPDLKKGRLSLSGIVVRSFVKAPEAAAPKPGGDQQPAAGTPAKPPAPPPAGPPATQQAASAAEAHAPGAEAKPGAAQEPVDSDPLGSPAIRIFHPGNDITYAYQVINAQVDNGKPQVDTQLRLFRDGKLVYSGKPLTIDPSRQPDAKHMLLGGRFRLGQKMTSGEYVMQVVATDKLAREKYRTAVSSIDFEVVEH